jgi:phosphate transport system substrate-binding protein
MRNRWAPAVAAAAALALVTACQGGVSRNGVSRGALEGHLTGSGATFPEPVFEEWMRYYSGSVETGVTIDYDAVGSGGGIAQFLDEAVDFGSSERYLESGELTVAREVRGCEAVQFPVVFGSVVIAFHNPALDGMVLDAEAIARIYDRQIKEYDDPYLARLNPEMDLPDAPIRPVHRSDGSGTTYVFTHYLTHEVSFWEENYSEGTDIAWHEETLGGDGNEGVTREIIANDGGLGYVNQSYAEEHDLATARVINAAGRPIAPSPEATTAATEEAEADIPDNFQFNLDDIGGDGYPIAGANWILAYECGYDEGTAEILRDFWIWVLEDETADELAVELGYAPMGRDLAQRVIRKVELVGSV